MKYYGKELSDNEIRNNILDSSSSIINNFFDENDFDNTEDDENQNFDVNSDLSLELGNLIDLNLPEFNLNFRPNEQSENSRNINIGVGNMLYDVHSLVQNIMFQNDFENDE